MRWNFLREKAVFMMFIIVCAIFTVNLAIPVSAEEEDKACCEFTKFGEQCRYTETENCNTAYAVGDYQTCEDTSFCQLGCCVSPEGLCSMKVSKAVCEGLQDYTWNPDENCNINECNKGCCVLAESQCKYTTEANCDNIMRGYPDIDKDFRMVTGEMGCRDVCRAEEEGCCVKNDEYVYTTRQVCGSDEFHPETYCSVIPESGCEAKDSKKCVDFDEDVYWFDSCGNKEEKAEDCDYLGGTLCGMDGEEAKCESVDCSETYDSPVIDYDGVSRFNGESWCEYESATGTGLDLVGSQHYRRMCLNGEEIVEPCRDYRQEICIQADALNGPQGIYREAACAPNNWQDCQTVCNSVKEVDSEDELEEAYRKDEQCCNALSRTCAWVEAAKGEGGTCLPVVPPGFKMPTGEEDTEALTTCEISNIEEKAAWYYATIETGYKNWECQGNCQLYDNDFLENMNHLCKSTGDCGADYNVLGEFTNDGLWRKWQGDPKGDPEHTLKAIGDYNFRKEAGEGLHIGEVDWLEMMSPVFDYAQKGKMEIGHPSGDMFISGAVLAGAAVLTYLILDMVVKGGFLAALTGSSGAATSGIVGAGAGTSAAGALVIIVAAIAIVLIVLASLYDTETRKVTVECTPWQAPKGGSDCEKCDTEFTECGPYKCSSLGSACKYIPENEGTDRPKCVAVEDNDPTSPKISAHRGSLSEGYTLKETEGTGYKIKPPVKPYKKFEFGIVTNKVSTCKIDTDYDKDRTYSDMAVYFPDQTKSKIHNMSVVLSPSDDVIKYYVMCEDANGNENTKPYVIELEAGEGRDIEAPVIEGTNYAQESYVSAETTEVGVELYVDEPSQCKWSSEDTGYEIMQNDLKCANSPPDPLFNAQTTCYTMLNLTEESNTYYFKCQDQAENTNSDSFVLTLHKTQPLLITQLEPSGEIYTKDVVLQVLTSSGAENGVAVCTTNGYNFFETNSTIHQQTLQNLPSGFYEYPITCQDIAGNLATGEINFTIAVDESYPLLTSLYKQGEGISIKLNEIANCQYSNEKFIYGEGTSMGENTVIHSATGSEEYHIICQDIYGNMMPEVVVYT